MQSKFATADFAEFFNAKVEKINEDTANAPPPSYTEIEGEWLSEFKLVMEEEVRRLIVSSPDKQCYIDSLPTWLLKKVSKDVSGLLTVIYYKSVRRKSSGTFQIGRCNAIVKAGRTQPGRSQQFHTNLQHLVIIKDVGAVSE